MHRHARCVAWFGMNEIALPPGEGADLFTAPARDALMLEIEGWEGPLDLLVDLARRQKVDLGGYRSNWSINISPMSARRSSWSWPPIIW